MAKRKTGKSYDEEELFGLNYQPEQDTKEVVGLNTSLEQDQPDTTAINNTEMDTSVEEDPILDQESPITMDEEDQTVVDEDEVMDEMDDLDEANNEGVNIPPAYAERDPDKDKDPLEGDDLGLREDDFLLNRKITSTDLEVHHEIHPDGGLGSNMRDPKKFASIFTRGQSTDQAPKVDTAYGIENNGVTQGEVAAKQLLRNCHSRDNAERGNAIHILQKMGLDPDVIQAIKSNSDAHEDSRLVALVGEYL